MARLSDSPLSKQRNVRGTVRDVRHGELRPGQEGQHLAPARRLSGLARDWELSQPGESLLPRPPSSSHRNTGEVTRQSTLPSLETGF